jgi:hypothetical protein
MENRKCVQCGLVNFADVVECARCSSFIPRVIPQPAGLNPFEREGKKPTNPLVILGIAGVALVGGIIAYSSFPAETAAAPTTQAAAPTASVIPDAQKLVMTPDDVKQQTEGFAKHQEELKKRMESVKKVEEDFKNGTRKAKPYECKTVGYSMNPSTGTYSPDVKCGPPSGQN